MMYDGWIYIAKSDTGHYKIGRSKTPVERVKHFDTIMPVEVKVIAMIPCDDYVAAEKALHKKYAGVKYKGEWFNLAPCEDELTNIMCFVDGDFIIRWHKESKLNSCCIDSLDWAIDNGRLIPAYLVRQEYQLIESDTEA